MLKDVNWAEDGTYTPQGEHKPIEFFSNALENSILFDLELGYFNSAAINMLSRSFATFINNGGHMRMAINQIVSKHDKEAIQKGQSGQAGIALDLEDWESLYQSLDEYGEHFFRCLAYLIQARRIQIVIIRPKMTNGLAHTKRGQFSDNQMVVSFTGSANFTLGGLINNLEEISLSFSTSSDCVVQKRIENQKSAFDQLMKGQAQGVEYLSSEDLQEAIQSKFSDHDIQDLLDVEEKLRRVRKEYHIEKEAGKTLMEGEAEYSTLPRFPYTSGPRPYQQEAFLKWKDNGQKGLFAMATGTGKTITSLNCLLEIYKRCGYYKALILVPTITLVNQWEEECRKFHFDNIIKVYSKNANWKSELDRIHSAETFRKDKDKHTSYVIISTYASFARPTIYAKLRCFDRERLLLIADEAHNMGSESMLKKLSEIPYLRRIGLSATPDRQYDEEGNKRLFAFFGAEKQFTYEYSMEEAIEKGVLSRYYYYPHLVRLNDLEMNHYIELSHKIAKYFNFNTERFDHKKDDILTGLLLARKRIVHKAAAKLEVFDSIIRERFAERGNLKYTLVYVPEGVEPDYMPESCIYDSQEEVPDDAEADKLIDQYTACIADLDRYMTVKKFVSGQKDRDEILTDFASGKLQVLTSMKCLDEGVDVPRSEVAIFCASTGNPRQFVQRRGRILRRHPEKHMAIIHDLVVAPEISPMSETFAMERSLLKGELKRVKNFALLSENPSDALMELRPVMQHYNLNLYNND